MFKGLTISVDSPENQIYLPASKILAIALGVAVHRGRHFGIYRSAIEKVLDGFLEEQDLGIREAKIRNLLDAMRIGFRKGDLHTNRRDGASLEEQKGGVEEFIYTHQDYIDKDPASVRELGESRERARELGLPHSSLWDAVSGDPRKERIIREAIENNPSENVTAGNRNLKGTPFSKFAVVDDDFDAPPSTPYNPKDSPALPPFVFPPLAWLFRPEGFTPVDRRFTGALPAFPQLDPSDRGLGLLPPTTAMPPDPQVHLFDPFTGVPNPGSGPSPILNPGAPNAGTPPPSLYAGAGLAALAVLFPSMWPYLAALGAGVAVNAPAYATESKGSAAQNDGSASASVAAAYNASGSGNAFSQSGATTFGHATTIPRESDAAVPEGESSFVDRFGAWIDTPGGAIPDASTADAPIVAGAGAVAADELRRLTRSNGSTAGSVFISGSAPVPHLTSPELEDRFGDWNVQVNRDGSGQTSKPIGAFFGEPGYLIPPPIFGVQGSQLGDAEQWFSRWIKPHLGPQ